MAAKYIKIDACHLSNLIKKIYNKKFNVAYWMEGQRLVEVLSIGPNTIEEDKKLTDSIIDAWKSDKHTDTGEYPQLIEVLMCDLCSRNYLKSGDYLIEFKD